MDFSSSWVMVTWYHNSPRGWICLLMAVFAAAGLLGGCAAGGQKEAAATAALSATTVSPAYDTAEAAETYAAAGRDRREFYISA